MSSGMETEEEGGGQTVQECHTQLQLGIVVGSLPQARLSSVSQQSPGQPATAGR